MRKTKISNPRLEKYLFWTFVDELIAYKSLIKYQIYVLIIVIGVGFGVFKFIDPLPPPAIKMASGQENSSLEKVAKQYQIDFAKFGVEVELVPSRGAQGNIELLERGLVDIALSQGGLIPENLTGMMSLGSIGYQPLWFITKDASTAADFNFRNLAGMRVSIGKFGSGTRPVADQVLNLISPELKGTMELFAYNGAESIAALKNDEIDGVFFLAGVQSGNLQGLLSIPGVYVANFSIATGLTRILPFMDVVKLPKGSINPELPFPARDITMIATTTTVLAKDTLHPAIQALVPKIAQQFENYTADAIGGRDLFPQFLGEAIPKSEIAQRYINDGPTIFEQYMPFWAADLAERSWIFIVGFVAVVLPLLGMIPLYRKDLFSVYSDNAYSELLDVRYAIYQSKQGEPVNFHQILKQLNEIQEYIDTMWVPKASTFDYIELLDYFNNLKSEVEELTKDKTVQKSSIIYGERYK